MAYTDWRFLFVFLPGVLGLYFLVARVTSHGAGNGRLRFGIANWVLAAGGLAFLAAGTGRFAGVLGGAAALLYMLGRGISSGHPYAPAARPDRISAVPEICFSLAVTGSLFLFVFFRHLNPFAGAVRPWLDTFSAAPFPAPGLLAPLGLSMFVCHAVSYAADIHRGEAAAPRNPVHALAYLLLFPFMVAGPLVRFRDVSAHLAARRVGMAAFAYGVRRFTIGLAKVWLIAGTLAPPADAAFSMPASMLDAAHAWLGLACFALQIYFALSGYADMALGLGRMLGFRLPEHFQWPYAADSLHAFWRRWSMTLVAWLDAYLRLPLRPDSDGIPGPGGAGDPFSVPAVSADRRLARAGLAAASLGRVARRRGRIGENAVGQSARRLARAHPPRLRAAGRDRRLDPLPRRQPAGRRRLRAGAGRSRRRAVPEQPAAVDGGVQIALVVGAFSAAPLLPAVSRWSVTVDAIATALQMIVTAAALFVWTRVLGQGRR